MFDISRSTAEQESEGVWADYGEGRFKIAHTNNLVFQREFSRLQAPHRKKIERGTLDPKIQLQIMCKAMAKGILLDWENVGSGGNEVPYSREMAEKVLFNNSDLRDFVTEFSTDLENYVSEGREELGNS